MRKILLVLLAVMALSPALVAQANVPFGFEDELMTSSLSQPVAFAWLPDGRILIAEQVTRQIKVLTASGAVGTLGTVNNVNTSGNERGLLGLAVDPQWPARPYIYVHYTSLPQGDIEIAMYTITGDVSTATSTSLALGSKYLLLNDPNDLQFNHNGGACHFGPDGHLYVALGDDASSCTAQNNNSLQGVILRLDVSSLPGAGAGPPAKSTLVAAGNPFGGTNSQLVWAYGLRNPFRFTIDPNTGNLHIGDVGQNSFEEMDICLGPMQGPGGENFGWPIFEGNSPFSSCGGASGPYVAPYFVDPHQGFGSRSIIAGPLYRDLPGQPFGFGPMFDGASFHFDYYVGTLRVQFPNGSGGFQPSQNWATGIANTSDMQQGPDGAIYYLRQFPGQLRRIKSTANLPSLNVVSGDGQVGNAGQTLPQPLVVQLTASGGAPIAGSTVNFNVVGGNATVNPTSAVTDASGFAQTSVTLSATPISANPNLSVDATSSGANPATFNLTFRGMTAQALGMPAFAYLVNVAHSQANAPVTIAFQTPQVMSPILVLPGIGDIFTDIVTMPANVVALDGLGLVGPANPAIMTAGNGVYTLFLTNLPNPPLGMTFTGQAYGVDTTLLPGTEAFMVTNPVTLDI